MFSEDDPMSSQGSYSSDAATVDMNASQRSPRHQRLPPALAHRATHPREDEAADDAIQELNQTPPLLRPRHSSQLSGSKRAQPELPQLDDGEHEHVDHVGHLDAEQQQQQEQEQDGENRQASAAAAAAASVASPSAAAADLVSSCDSPQVPHLRMPIAHRCSSCLSPSRQSVSSPASASFFGSPGFETPVPMVPQSPSVNNVSGFAAGGMSTPSSKRYRAESVTPTPLRSVTPLHFDSAPPLPSRSSMGDCGHFHSGYTPPVHSRTASRQEDTSSRISTPVLQYDRWPIPVPQPTPRLVSAPPPGALSATATPASGLSSVPSTPLAAMTLRTPEARNSAFNFRQALLQSPEARPATAPSAAAAAVTVVGPVNTPKAIPAKTTQNSMKQAMPGSKSQLTARAHASAFAPAAAAAAAASPAAAGSVLKSPSTVVRARASTGAASSAASTPSRAPSKTPSRTASTTKTPSRAGSTNKTPSRTPSLKKAPSRTPSGKKSASASTKKKKAAAAARLALRMLVRAGDPDPAFPLIGKLITSTSTPLHKWVVRLFVDCFKNPYPSAQELAVISAHLSIPVLDVRTAFNNLRQRGWQEIIQAIFSGQLVQSNRASPKHALNRTWAAPLKGADSEELPPGPRVCATRVAAKLKFEQLQVLHRETLGPVIVTAEDLEDENHNNDEEEQQEEKAEEEEEEDEENDEHAPQMKAARSSADASSSSAAAASSSGAASGSSSLFQPRALAPGLNRAAARAPAAMGSTLSHGVQSSSLVARLRVEPPTSSHLVSPPPARCHPSSSDGGMSRFHLPAAAAAASATSPIAFGNAPPAHAIARLQQEHEHNGAAPSSALSPSPHVLPFPFAPDMSRFNAYDVARGRNILAAAAAAPGAAAPSSGPSPRYL